MVQISDFARDMITAFLVVGTEIVGLDPEIGFVDAETTKQGSLHVFGDQRLVEVPDARDDVLGEKGRGHDSRADGCRRIDERAAPRTMR